MLNRELMDTSYISSVLVDTHHEEIPEIVGECAKRINSKFFSVDVIERADGEMRVVEIGDGQVSDLANEWTKERFTVLWVENSNSREQNEN